MLNTIKEYFLSLYHAIQDGTLSYPSLKDIWGRMLEVFSAPTADPVATITSSLFLLTVFAIIFVIGLLIFLKLRDDHVMREQRREFNEKLLEKDPENAEAIIRESSVESRWFIAMASILTLFALFVGLNIGTSTDKVCVSCHQTTLHETKIQTGAHKNASCVSCHEPSGLFARTVTSFIPRMVHIAQGTQAAQRSRTLVQQTTGNTSGAYTSSDGITVDTNAIESAVGSSYGGVNSQSCLACHESVKKGVATNQTSGISIRHKDPLEQGSKCTDCHGEGTSGQIIYTQRMDACLKCHDGSTASAECSTCHVKSFDTAAAVRAKPAVGNQHDLTMNCYTCHDTARCDACHGGVRMPHSEQFKTTGLHAYDAAQALWNNTTKCSKCHPLKTDCNTKCHGTLPYHYGVIKSFPKTHVQGMFENKPCGLCHYDFNPTRKLENTWGPDYACVSCHSTAGASTVGGMR